jgi:hypothetical protein
MGGEKRMAGCFPSPALPGSGSTGLLHPQNSQPFGSPHKGKTTPKPPQGASPILRQPHFLDPHPLFSQEKLSNGSALNFSRAICPAKNRNLVRGDYKDNLVKPTARPRKPFDFPEHLRLNKDSLVSQADNL